MKKAITPIIYGTDIISTLEKQRSCNNMKAHQIISAFFNPRVKNAIKYIELRSNGVWYDTLHIEVYKKSDMDLFVGLAYYWKCDEIHWIDKQDQTTLSIAVPGEYVDPKRFFLRLWWD